LRRTLVLTDYASARRNQHYEWQSCRSAQLQTTVAERLFHIASKVQVSDTTKTL